MITMNITTATVVGGDKPDEKEMEHVQLAMVCATLLFSICTIITNLLTLAVMLRHGLIRKNTINMHIASLCASDSLVGVSALPFQLLQLTKSNHQEMVAITWTAAVAMSVGFFTCHSNAFLVGVNRVCATLAPHAYKRL
ncbi:hypothetical protein CAPTEDRAFT_210099, partial [Capitella teleta]